MAAIDKTYVSSYEDWKEIIDWAKKTVFTCPNGIKFHVIDWCYTYSDSTEDDIRDCLNNHKTIPVMNTPQALDYFLIKYCPIKVVQDRLREVYNSDFIDSVLKGISIYDTFVKPNFGKHYKFIKKPKLYYNSICYYVDVTIPKEISLYPSYNMEYNIWLMDNELGYATTHNGSFCFRVKSLKSLIRTFRKWKLPIGTKIDFIGQFEGTDGEIIITN